MLRILPALALALAALATVPSASALNDPHLPCYPDFYGGTVCVVGEEPAPCFAIVAFNPDPRHPQYPVGVSPVYCREANGGATQVTPCLPADPSLLGVNGPYC